MTDRPRKSQFSNPKGFYYLNNSYEYHRLDNEEVDYFPEYILKQVEKDNNLGEGFAHLEEYQVHAHDYGQDVLYYVKVGKDYRGKLTVVYRIVGETFWVQAYYYARTYQSLTQRASRKAMRRPRRTYEELAKVKNKKNKDYHNNSSRFGKETPRK